MHFMNKHHKVSFSYYFIFDRIICVLVTFWERGHFVILIIKSLHLINLHFWTYLEPTCYFVIFALCSLVANSKIGACFFTKLCGCGVGEQSCCGKPKFERDQGDKVFKVIACFMRFISSGICLFLTIRDFKI